MPRGISLLPILLYSDEVPESARDALLAATAAPAGEQRPHLEAAARALYRETLLDCADARELVGL